MSVHTIDPATNATDHAIRDLLTALDNKPVRYENPNGQVTNTTTCRGLIAWYVLIDAAPDTIHVGAIRVGLGAGVRGIVTRQHLRPAETLAYPDGGPESVEAFTRQLAVTVGMALDDIERARP